MPSALSLVVALAFVCSSCGEPPADQSEEQETASESLEEPEEARPDANAVFCDIVDRSVSPRDCEDLRAIEGQVKRGTAAFNVPSPMKRGRREFVVLVIDRRRPEIVAQLDAATENATDTAPAGENATAPIENAATMTENPVENASRAGEEPAADPADAVRSGENTAVARPVPRPAVDDAGSEEQPPVDLSAPTPQQHVDPLKGDTETLTPKVGRYMSADLTGDGFNIRRLTARSQEIPPGNQARWQWEVTATESGKRQLTLVTVVEGKVGGQRYPLARTFSVQTVDVRVAWSDRLGGTLDAIPEWIQKLTLVLLAIIGLVAAAFRLRALVRARRADDEADQDLEEIANETLKGETSNGNSKRRKKQR